MASDTFDVVRLDKAITEAEIVQNTIQVPFMNTHGWFVLGTVPRDTQDNYDGIDVIALIGNTIENVDCKHRNYLARGTDLPLEESGPGTHNWRTSKTDIFFLSAWNKALNKYQHTAYYKRDLIRIVDEIGLGTVVPSNEGQMIRYIPTNHLWALDIFGGAGQ